MSTAKPHPLKVLFLDIDGVINSKRSQRAFGGYPRTFGQACLARFDWVAVGLVRRLCTESGCSVVLSSDWRYDTNVSVHAAADALDLPIMGATPFGSSGTIRGDEVDAWLAVHPEVTHYAIVDDVRAFRPHHEAHLVLTSPTHGLTLANFRRLRQILGA